MSEDGLRLNKLISLMADVSRRQADVLISEGRVTVDGRPGVAGMRVLPGACILLDGKELVREECEPERVLLAVNKPRGVVCTADRRWGDVLAEDLVESRVRLFYVGRLDKDSEGLLLMTNQGDLANRMMKARNYHEKEYLVQVDRRIDEAFLKKMAQGVFLSALQVTTRPCRISKVDAYTFRIVLTQGLNRQIRRMCETFGYHVKLLRRIRIMNIELGDLRSGQSRPVTGEEWHCLEKLLEGSENNMPDEEEP